MMSGLRPVTSFVQSTDEVERGRGFDFWRDSVLSTSRGGPVAASERRAFAARRLVAVTPNSTLFRTESKRIDALRSLALVHISRNLHDPTFEPKRACLSLGVSRSRLYRAFADGEGIASAIRDACLDRAHRLLSSDAGGGGNVSTAMWDSGFTNATNFSRAFRRRFGMAPRDVLNLRGD